MFFVCLYVGLEPEDSPQALAACDDCEESQTFHVKPGDGLTTAVVEGGEKLRCFFPAACQDGKRREGAWGRLLGGGTLQGEEAWRPPLSIFAA